MKHPHISERMPSEDAVFLYLEREEAPMHMQSVSIFQGTVPFEAYLNLVESKLPLIPRMRQRLVISPFNAGHPVWEWDPDFDIRNHLQLVRLKRGTEAELQQISARLFSSVMDRNKPLWDTTLVEGLSGGRSALIMRLHHCVADGVGGVGVLCRILDPTPQPQPLPKQQPFHAPPISRPENSLLDALASSYSEMIGQLLSAESALLDVTESVIQDGELPGVDRLIQIVPELLTPVERLPFNRPCLGPRKLVWTDRSIAEIKAIREACGGTLNDVVLTAVTTAVRRYCELHGESLKKRLLRVMIPVNVRHSEDGTVGNKVSMLPVSFPLDVRDPVKLLHAIQQRTEILKRAKVADLISLAGAWMSITPAPVQAALGLFANLLPLPPFNLVCTNVPGPQYPLYAVGHKMLTYYPCLPVGAEMGVGFAVESYNHNLFFGITGDHAAAPDVARLKTFLDQAFDELSRAAGVPQARVKRAKPRARRKAAVPAAEPEQVPVTESPLVAETIPQPIGETGGAISPEPAEVDEVAREILSTVEPETTVALS